MVSDEEIRRWAEKYYPEYAHNIELMRMLYERRFGRGVEVNGRRYEEKTLKEVNVGDYVRVKGIVVGYERSYTHIGCPNCFRKQCNCRQGKAKIIRNAYTFGDGTDTILLIMPMKVDDGQYEFEGGEEIVVEGQVKEFRGKKELSVHGYKVLRKPDLGVIDEKTRKIQEVIENLKPVKDMEKTSFLRYIERKYGLSWDDVKDFVRIEKKGSEEWVIFE